MWQQIKGEKQQKGFVYLDTGFGLALDFYML